MDGSFRTGMLWFDNDKSADLPTKVRRAADYYRKKFGISPNLCFVNPASAIGAQRVGEVEIRGSNRILQNHYWLGVVEHGG